MVIDIDDFKQINDHFGRHSGDRIDAVVQRFRRHARAVDIVARSWRRRICCMVRTEERWEALIAQKLKNDSWASCKKTAWPVTFDISITIPTPFNDHEKEAIKAADELMYIVKRNGKNNIRHASIKTVKMKPSSMKIFANKKYGTCPIFGSPKTWPCFSVIRTRTAHGPKRTC